MIDRRSLCQNVWPLFVVAILWTGGLSALQLFAFSTVAIAETIEGVEAEGVALVRREFPDDAGAMEIANRYDEESDGSLKRISFSALAIYVELTLGSKFGPSSPKHRAIIEMQRLSEKHSALQK